MMEQQKTTHCNNCLPKNTLIHTKHGMIPIQDVKIGDEVLTSYGIYEKVVATYHQGHQPILKIITKDGFFRCTPTHRMAVWSLDKKSIQWKYANTLKHNDRLMTSRIPVKGDRVLLPTYKQYHTIHLNPTISWFLGYCCCQQTHVLQKMIFPAPNFDTATKIKLSLIQFEPLWTMRFLKKDDNTFLVAPEGNNKDTFRLYLQDILRKTTVSPFILKSYLHNREAFIAGVCDGGADGDIFVARSYAWIHSLQTLFYSCGIETTLKYYDNDYWQLKMPTFFSKQKIKLLKEVKNPDRIKISFWEKWVHEWTPHNKFFYTTPIRQIIHETKEHETWDITVENEHNFYANGYLTHNSQPPTCLTGDTRIMTSQGLKLVHDIVGKQFHVILEGQVFPSSVKGFWMTGSKEVVKIRLEHGIEIKATPNHRFMTFDDWKYVDQLQVGGDSLFLSVGGDYNWGGKGTMDEGYVAGYLIGNKTYYYSHIPMATALVAKHINPEDFGPIQHIQRIYQENRNKHKYFTFVGDDLCYKQYQMTSFLFKKIAREYNLFGDDGMIHVYEKGSYHFTIGLLRGLFDAAGIIYNNMEEKTSIRLWEDDNQAVLCAIQRLLLLVGIVSYVRKEDHMECHNPNGDELVILEEDDVALFQEKIGFLNNEKKLMLSGATNDHIHTRKKYCYSRIVSIEPAGRHDVYDCAIERSHCFSANGVLSHNCSDPNL